MAHASLQGNVALQSPWAKNLQLHLGGDNLENNECFQRREATFVVSHPYASLYEADEAPTALLYGLTRHCLLFFNKQDAGDFPDLNPSALYAA